MFFQTPIARKYELFKTYFLYIRNASKPETMSLSSRFGKEGEQMALRFLQKKGYRILKQNYRYRKAEIDLIAQKDNILAIVEVKFRSSTYFGAPESFVSQKKIQLLIMAADHYVCENDLSVTVRFDIISILKENNQTLIQHIEDAFYFF